MILRRFLTRIYPISLRYQHTVKNAASLTSSKIYDCSSKEIEELALNQMIIINDFINQDEEDALLKDIEPRWRRLKYQFDHWDNAIQGYRETELSRWSDKSSKILQRLREIAFRDADCQRDLVHVLDLSEDGHIKPHVDSIRFCGRVIAGLSLLSPCVMKLTNEKDDSKYFTVLLNRRSLYIMSDLVRYDYAHEILKTEESKFKGKKVIKGRRISVICRSTPENTDTTDNGELFKPKVMTLEPDP